MARRPAPVYEPIPADEPAAAAPTADDLAACSDGAMSVKDAAVFAAACVRVVTGWVSSRRLRSYKRGARRVILKRDLVEFLAAELAESRAGR